MQNILKQDLSSYKYALTVVAANDEIRALKIDQGNKYGQQLYDKQLKSYKLTRDNALSNFNKKYNVNAKNITWTDIQLVEVPLIGDDGAVIYEDGRAKMGKPTRRELAKMYNYKINDPLYETLRPATDYVHISYDEIARPSVIVMFIMLFIIIIFLAFVYAASSLVRPLKAGI